MKNYELISELSKLPAGAEFVLKVSVFLTKLIFKKTQMMEKYTLCPRLYAA